MLVSPDVQRKYRDTEPAVKYVGQQVSDRVRAYCENNGYAYVHRYKEVASVAEKIESGRYQSWSELDDLFGCAVIMPTLISEETAISFLCEEFEKVDIRSRSLQKKDPSVFRFDSTRFIGRLRPSDDMAPNIRSVCFEVQIRTAFEHAWAVTTHSLTYKARSTDWRRLRLASQLKAAVEQLDMLVLAFSDSAMHLPISEWPDVDARQQVERFFKEKSADGMIPDHSQPKDWTRFCENVVSLIKAGQPQRNYDIKKEVTRALSIIDEKLKNGPALLASLTLFQDIIGILLEAQFLKMPLHKFVPLITQEMTICYPTVSGIETVFRLDQ